MDRYRAVGAVIAAAGSSSRMGGRDKLAEPLDGIPVILRTLAAVEAVPEIREIVVVTREDRVEEYRRLLGRLNILAARQSDVVLECAHSMVQLHKGSLECLDKALAIFEGQAAYLKG